MANSIENNNKFTTFNCRRCGKEFLSKAHYKNHSNNKNICKLVIEDIIPNEDNFLEVYGTVSCDICGSKIKLKNDFIQHKKKCIEKQEQNIVIDRNKLQSDLPIIFAKSDYSFFDLLTIIEKAQEVHIISSCFLSFFMVKKLNIKTFAHMYADRSELTEMVKKNGIDVIL